MAQPVLPPDSTATGATAPKKAQKENKLHPLPLLLPGQLFDKQEVLVILGTTKKERAEIN